MATSVITTPLSQSSLLFLSKPPSSSLSLRPSFPPDRFRSPFRFTARFAATADIRSSENIEFREEIGGGGDLGRGEGSGGSGGSGGGGGGGEEESEGGSEKDKKKMDGTSMSQKLTLGYAVLVGVGGVMGYVKSGSQKSLATGGLSALMLYNVYTQLPTRPVFASSLGLGLSSALLGVMGSRFKKSGKVFPAGVVSVVSFIMAGGYIHGILRSSLA